jgi:hypothetical protein
MGSYRVRRVYPSILRKPTLLRKNAFADVSLLPFLLVLRTLSATFVTCIIIWEADFAHINQCITLWAENTSIGINDKVIGILAVD